MVRYQTGLKFTYPEKIDGHMIDPKQVRNVSLDGDYPFYHTSKFFRFCQIIINFLFWIVAIPIVSLRYGLKVKGRKNLRGEFAKQVKNGFVTTCNHVFDWDYLCIRSIMFPRRGYFLVWINNHYSALGKLMRVTGSIPVPHSYEGLKKFDRDIKNMLHEKRWLHVYPEASMWYYKEDIRPYKNGAFTIAYDNKVPVVPLAISFRPAKGIFKLWKRHGYPCITVSIGKPEWPNLSLERKDSIAELNSRVHKITLKMKEEATPLISEEKQNKIFAEADV